MFSKRYNKFRWFSAINWISDGISTGFAYRARRSDWLWRLLTTTLESHRAWPNAPYSGLSARRRANEDDWAENPHNRTGYTEGKLVSNFHQIRWAGISRRVLCFSNFPQFFHRKTLPMHIRECVDCYTRPWKLVEFSQRHFSSSCLMRDQQRLNKGALSPGIGQQEFEIDREYYSLDETMTYRVRSKWWFMHFSSLMRIFSNSHRLKVVRRQSVAGNRLRAFRRCHRARMKL